MYNSSDGFLNEMRSRVARFEKKYGSLADLENEFEAQMLRMKTCPDCSFVCKTMWHMENRHQGSIPCKKRIAEARGEEFTPPGKERVVCECGDELFRCNMEKHLGGDIHKNHMANKRGYRCDVCDVSFTGNTRPKRDLQQHCRGKKHLRRIAQCKVNDVVHECCGDAIPSVPSV